MDDRYEAFCLASPVFYDVLHSDEAARPTFPTADEPLPAGWRRRTQDDWIVFIPPRRDGPALPAQGWKIHVSATLDNAERVLTVVRGYCIGRGIEFSSSGRRPRCSPGSASTRRAGSAANS
ncbi:hypothetical protein ACFQX7_33880 [Luedemannella flava]